MLYLLSMYYLAIFLTVFSNLFYHLSLKFLPEKANPFISLSVSYLIAFILTIIIYILSSNKNQINVVHDFKGVGYLPFLLGIVIVGIEMGFILAYRAGWQISYAALVSNICVTVLLVLVGYFFLKESLTIQKIAGIFFAIIGIILINWK